jgi:hypothetical protein
MVIKMSKKTKVAVKRVPSSTMKLSQLEVVHLRDLMSVLLTTSSTTTLSEQLAENENRRHVESRLWEKVCDACAELDVPLENEAPEYVIGLAATPQLNVYELTMVQPTSEHISSKFDEEE